MLHRLREASVEQVVASHPDIGGIPDPNITRLRALSIVQIRALWE